MQFNFQGRKSSRDSSIALLVVRSIPENGSSRGSCFFCSIFSWLRKSVSCPPTPWCAFQDVTVVWQPVEHRFDGHPIFEQLQPSYIERYKVISALVSY